MDLETVKDGSEVGRGGALRAESQSSDIPFRTLFPDLKRMLNN